MLNSDMLEVAIGLIFVYLLFSFIATAAREVIEGLLKDRGAFLEHGILSLMSEPHGDDIGEVKPDDVVRSSEARAKDRAESLIEQLYRSPPIHGLFRGNYVPPTARTALSKQAQTAARKRLPSYIPAEQFAEGLLAVVMQYSNSKAGGARGSLDRLRLAVEGVPNAQVRNIVRTSIRLSGGDPEKMRRHIQDWYNGAMDRVSGQYRRHTQWMVLLTSVAVAVILNVNTIVIVQALTTQDALRSAIAKNAELVAADKSFGGAAAVKGEAAVQTAQNDLKLATEAAEAAKTAANGVADPAREAEVKAKREAAAELKGLNDQQSEQTKAQVAHIRAIGLPIGWDAETAKQTARTAFTGPSFVPGNWRVYPVGGLIVGLGWLMTGLAISLGAPFWFDVLNKFMVVRATVKPAEKSGPEGSKDSKAPPKPEEAQDTPGPVMSSGGRSAVAEDDHHEIATLDPNERPREGDPLVEAAQ